MKDYTRQLKKIETNRKIALTLQEQFNKLHELIVKSMNKIQSKFEKSLNKQFKDKYGFAQVENLELSKDWGYIDIEFISSQPYASDNFIIYLTKNLKIYVYYDEKELKEYKKLEKELEDFLIEELKDIIKLYQ